MAIAYPFSRPRHKRAPQWHSIQRAIFVALAPAWAASASAQAYTNYDGSPNTDLTAAAQTWADHGEFNRFVAAMQVKHKAAIDKRDKAKAKLAVTQAKADAAAAAQRKSEAGADATE